MMGRGIRQQNFLGLLQIMSANPAMMQLVNWANFARQAFELFDFKNVNELLVNTVPAVNQIAAGAGMSPEALAATVSQPMDQLSPDVLSQLTNMQNPAPISTAARTPRLWRWDAAAVEVRRVTVRRAIRGAVWSVAIVQGITASTSR